MCVDVNVDVSDCDNDDDIRSSSSLVFDDLVHGCRALLMTFRRVIPCRSLPMDCGRAQRVRSL